MFQQKKLYKNFSVIFQNNTLFQRSILENILYGYEDSKEYKNNEN